MSTTSKGSNGCKAKVTLDGITRVISLTPFVSWSEFEELVGQLFNHPNKSFSATYYDKEDDLILIDRQEEFEDYLDNSIGSKLILKVGQDKDNDDWTVMKPADEISLNSPSQIDPDEERQEKEPKSSVDPVSSSLLQRFFPNYQTPKAVTQKEEEDQLLQEILQRSHKALLELDSPSNTSARSLDHSRLPSLSTSEQLSQPNPSTEASQSLNVNSTSPTPSFSHSNSSEHDHYLDTPYSPPLPPSLPATNINYHSNSEHDVSPIDSILADLDSPTESSQHSTSHSTTTPKSHETTVNDSSIKQNTNIESNSNDTSAIDQNETKSKDEADPSNSTSPPTVIPPLQCSLPRLPSLTSIDQPENIVDQSPRLTSSLADYPVSTDIEHVDEDSSITEEEFSSPRSTSPDGSISNPFMDVIEEDITDEQNNQTFEESSNNVDLDSRSPPPFEHFVAICPPHPDFMHEFNPDQIREEIQRNAPPHLAVCPPHPDFVNSNNSEIANDNTQSPPRPFVAICPPHPSYIAHDGNQFPDVEENGSDRNVQESENNTNSAVTPTNCQDGSTLSFPFPAPPSCILRVAAPPHVDTSDHSSPKGHGKTDTEEGMESNQREINNSNEPSSDHALNNITQLSRLFDQYRSCIPEHLNLTSVVDILIDQIVSGVEIDNAVLEVTLQNLSAQNYHPNFPPSGTVFNSFNTLFRQFGNSLNQFMDQFNNNPNIGSDQSGPTQDSTEAPSNRPTNEPLHHPHPTCSRNEPIHWPPHFPHPPLHPHPHPHPHPPNAPPHHRPPLFPPHSHPNFPHHPPPPPPPHCPGRHPRPHPPPHHPGPHPGPHPRPHHSHHSTHSSHHKHETNDNTDSNQSYRPRRRKWNRKHKFYNYQQIPTEANEETTPESVTASSSTVIVNHPSEQDNRDSLFPMREELKSRTNPDEVTVESDNEIEVEVYIPPRRSHTYSYSQSQLNAQNSLDNSQPSGETDQHDKPDMLHQMRVLNDMGFHNDRINYRLLEAFEGNLQEVVNHLLITGYYSD